MAAKQLTRKVLRTKHGLRESRTCLAGEFGALDEPAVEAVWGGLSRRGMQSTGHRTSGAERAEERQQKKEDYFFGISTASMTRCRTWPVPMVARDQLPATSLRGIPSHVLFVVFGGEGVRVLITKSIERETAFLLVNGLKAHESAMEDASRKGHDYNRSYRLVGHFEESRDLGFDLL